MWWLLLLRVRSFSSVTQQLAYSVCRSHSHRLGFACQVSLSGFQTFSWNSDTILLVINKITYFIITLFLGRSSAEMLLECGFVPDDPFFIFVEPFFYFNSEGFYLRILFLKGVFRYLNLCFQVFKLLFKLFCVRALVKSVTYFLILQKLTLLFKFLNISCKQYITLQIELFHPSYFDSMIFQAVFQVLRQ